MFVITQLSILFLWQLKVIALIVPFLPLTFLYILYYKRKYLCLLSVSEKDVYFKQGGWLLPEDGFLLTNLI
jgi:hypothetical protein